jgi:hypothetical protein
MYIDVHVLLPDRRPARRPITTRQGGKILRQRSGY